MQLELFISQFFAQSVSVSSPCIVYEYRPWRKWNRYSVKPNVQWFYFYLCLSKETSKLVMKYLHILIEVYKIQSIHAYHNFGTADLVELFNKADHLQHSRGMPLPKKKKKKKRFNASTYALVFSSVLCYCTAELLSSRGRPSSVVRPSSVRSCCNYLWA